MQHHAGTNSRIRSRNIIRRNQGLATRGFVFQLKKCMCTLSISARVLSKMRVYLIGGNEIQRNGSSVQATRGRAENLVGSYRAGCEIRRRSIAQLDVV